MIPEYNSKSLAIGVPGLLLQIAGAVSRVWLVQQQGAQLNMTLMWATVAAQLIGSIMLIVGLGYYAKAKGYSGALGLLGLLSCIGILILAILPDKNK
jgi:hypothetical protein